MELQRMKSLVKVGRFPGHFVLNVAYLPASNNSFILQNYILLHHNSKSL